MKNIFTLLLLPLLSLHPLRAEETAPAPTGETREGMAAAESAETSKVSNKTWRRVGLITAGVAVATLAIYSVAHNQGKEVNK